MKASGKPVIASMGNMAASAGYEVAGQASGHLLTAAFLWRATPYKCRAKDPDCSETDFLAAPACIQWFEFVLSQSMAALHSVAWCHHLVGPYQCNCALLVCLILIAPCACRILLLCLNDDAAAADKVVAQPGTLTGSIGVADGKLNFAPALKQLGVNVEAVSVGKHALMHSYFTGSNRQEDRWINTMLDRCDHYKLPTLLLMICRSASSSLLHACRIVAVLDTAAWTVRSTTCLTGCHCGLQYVCRC